jgi:hypothetical protein
MWCCLFLHEEPTLRSSDSSYCTGTQKVGRRKLRKEALQTAMKSGRTIRRSTSTHGRRQPEGNTSFTIASIRGVVFWLPTFRRNVLLPSSGLKKGVLGSRYFYKTRRRMWPGGMASQSYQLRNTHHFSPEDRCSMFLWNVGIHLNTTQHNSLEHHYLCLG